MRKEYLHLCYKHIRNGRILFMLKQACKVGALKLFPDRARPRLFGPIQSILMVTYLCNLKCQMCDLWRRPAEKAGDKYEELEEDKWIKIIDDLAEMGTTGIGFAGGEPLMNPSLPRLIKHAHNYGITTHVATNGILLNSARAQQLIDSGLDAISFSLDSKDEEVNDKIRGVKGSFKRTIKGIEILNELRKTTNRDMVISVNVTLSKSNSGSLNELADLALKSGADSLGCIPVQESGFDSNRINDYSSMRIDKSVEKISNEINTLVERGILDNSPEYIATLPHFMAGKELPIPCRVRLHTIVVDPQGYVYPCIPYANEGKSKSYDNIANASLKEIWSHERYQKLRDETALCRKCFWNCHTEVNLVAARKSEKEKVFQTF